MNSLLFITHEYPINRGDSSFITNEITYLSDKFDKIYVLCLSKRPEDDNLLTIPHNVILNFTEVRYGKLKKLKYLFSFPVYLIQELKTILKKEKIIQCIRSALSFFIEASLLRSAIKQILKNDSSISLVYTYWYSCETMSALFLKSQFKIRCVTRTHGYDLYEFRNDVNYQPYKIWMDKRLNKIYFISKDGYDYYMKIFINARGGGGLEKYQIFRLGVLNKFNLVENERADILKIISCSSIIPVKRINLIVEALAEIDEINIHWVHIGDDKNLIMPLANKLLNKKNISFEFKGFMINEQVLKYYSENYFDCFISVSESEGLPVSMMEAISFGIPIIATNVGGVAEIVAGNGEGERGGGELLEPNPSPSEISKEIINFYHLPDEKKNAMRRAARLLWEANFNANTNFIKFAEDLYGTKS